MTAGTSRNGINSLVFSGIGVPNIVGSLMLNMAGRMPIFPTWRSPLDLLRVFSRAKANTPAPPMAIKPK